MIESTTLNCLVYNYSAIPKIFPNLLPPEKDF